MRGATQRMPCPATTADRSESSDQRLIPWVGDPIRTVRIFALPTLVVPLCCFLSAALRTPRPVSCVFPENCGTLIANKIHVDSPHTDSITLVASHGPE